ncbi:hypothetical protein FACS189459_2310 [Bacilli bacterium]|nr:hypothetical protein FACS189459_2310 [Bacilli bacterium]
MIHDKGLSFSKKTIRNILTDSMLISKDAHKNTIKHYRALIKAQKKPNLPVETVRVILNDPTLVDKSKQHMRLAEQERFGEEVQMDASEEC